MMLSAFKRLLVGNPLPSHQDSHERLNIPLALSVFAADALSSTAYATEEILLALLAASALLQANALSIPIAGSIVLLMAIVVLSYRQVIVAYPSGGGSYEVARERLGPLASQIAGAALLIDYVLTVAVSVSAGVAAIVSAHIPGLGAAQQVPLALLFILIMTLINLRGVKESGKVLAFPAYSFIAMMVLLIVWGFYQVSQGQTPPTPVGTVESPLDLAWNGGLLLLALKGFSHGCAALTGIEAVSNGVQAFKEPVAKNANRTLVLMGLILGSFFVGITVLANVFHVVPQHDRTVISLIAAQVFGDGTWLFFLFQASTTIILILAANTSFAGFPRLANILAHDGFLPRQLMSLGDRLVFSNGILILGLVSALLVWMYHAETHALIPLYAVGVFLSFTLAQAGMVNYHLHFRHKNWKRGIAVNALGAVTTGVVTLILTVEKFVNGAWLVCVAIPALIWVFKAVQTHYKTIARQLALPTIGGHCPIPFEHTVLVLVSSLNRGTIPALEYAKSIGHHVEAVHIALNEAGTQRLKDAWDDWGCGIPLTILHSPYRSLIQPLLDYIDVVEDRYDHDIVTIVVPEFVTKQWWHNLLHNQTSLLIKTILRFRKGKVVTSVRYYLEE